MLFAHVSVYAEVTYLSAGSPSANGSDFRVINARMRPQSATYIIILSLKWTLSAVPGIIILELIIKKTIEN